MKRVDVKAILKNPDLRKDMLTRACKFLCELERYYPEDYSSEDKKKQ